MYRKDRQSEHYTDKAHKEGYPARSIYKLKEINEKFKAIKPKDIVLDLGCAPGSWLIYSSDIIGPKGRVLGVDTNDLGITLPKNCLFIKEDIFNLKSLQLKEYFPHFDVVVSDMAPSTSGIDFLDAGRSLELSQRAFEIALEVLKPGGNFVCKVFESYESNQFIKEVGKHFEFLKHARPKAVFKKSKEFYIVAKKLKS
ncbi:MAG: RlmE family RNA methyltransferase [Candidatus Paceibacterota bacterium]|jgi:23S rRNA (uridine2552-2'-O)-methyltransferase